jgi:glycine oxidase
MARARHITVVGAGVTGLWQACELAYRGHCVKLIERSPTPFSNAASQYAGAMLAPYCEREGADAIVQDLGLEGLERWKRLCPAVVGNGTLVVALPRDRSELTCFAARAEGHRLIDTAELMQLEPDVAARFSRGLYFPAEAHVEPASALAFLFERARRLGVRVHFGSAAAPASDLIVDCRGLAARNELASLRGVRGERAVVRTGEVNISRTIRLLHPRLSLYVVPWGRGTYMLGATVMETDDAGPVTLRSTIDLLGLAFALHPAFGEARVLSLDTGIRPAFPDNLPRIIVGDGRILVNGLYRHGFLLAPVLARMVADHLEEKRIDSRLFAEGAPTIMPSAL